MPKPLASSGTRAKPSWSWFLGFRVYGLGFRAFGLVLFPYRPLQHLQNPQKSRKNKYNTVSWLRVETELHETAITDIAANTHSVEKARASVCVCFFLCFYIHIYACIYLCLSLSFKLIFICIFIAILISILVFLYMPIFVVIYVFLLLSITCIHIQRKYWLRIHCLRISGAEFRRN